MLPWFQNGQFPLYLAPMARFTDIVFREFCKEQGADVMVTEFVQADALTREDPKLCYHDISTLFFAKLAENDIGKARHRC